MNTRNDRPVTTMVRALPRAEDGRQFAMTLLLACAGAAMGLVGALALHGF